MFLQRTIRCPTPPASCNPRWVSLPTYHKPVISGADCNHGEHESKPPFRNFTSKPFLHASVPEGSPTAYTTPSCGLAMPHCPACQLCSVLEVVTSLPFLPKLPIFTRRRCCSRMPIARPWSSSRHIESRRCPLLAGGPGDPTVRLEWHPSSRSGILKRHVAWAVVRRAPLGRFENVRASTSPA